MSPLVEILSDWTWVDYLAHSLILLPLIVAGLVWIRWSIQEKAEQVKANQEFVRKLAESPNDVMPVEKKTGILTESNISNKA